MANPSKIRTTVVDTVMPECPDHLTTGGKSMHAQVPEPIQKLLRLEGLWEGDALITHNGSTICFRIHHDNTRVANGWGFQISESGEIPGSGLYRSVSIFGFDSELNQLHLYTVSSLGHAHDHRGWWADDTHVIFEYKGVNRGTQVIEWIPIVVLGPDEYIFQNSTSLGEEVCMIFEARMHRVL